MWMYWLLFVLVGWSALNHMRPVQASMLESGRRRATLGQGWFWLLLIVVGFRHEVGGDWVNYLAHIDAAAYQNFNEVALGSDPAYNILNWFAAHYFGGVYLVNLICGGLFAWGLLAFCRSLPRPWLALLVAVPYLITVVAMGYSRQGVAIGLAMLGLVALLNGRVAAFISWIAFAALFHKSAVILAPLAVFAGGRHRFVALLGILLSTALLFVLLLQESAEALVKNYVEAEMESSGAAIRIAMNALPAAVFLIWRKRFAMTDRQRGFWTWISLGALGFVGLLVVSPSSTAVDRLALYWIPLQLVVWSHFPDVIGRPGQANSLWVVAVVAYSAAVLFVWLFFATFSSAWLPYQFYPWVWLWS